MHNKNFSAHPPYILSHTHGQSFETRFPIPDCTGYILLIYSFNISPDISKIEIGKPLGLDALISIANALGVSPDDLLVDSLEYPASTADSELHRLLLDCNKIEEEILTRTVKELKAILYGLGI
ncbi:MAG: hypothetical protein LUD18_05260 [Lachnospiraceae bacterium]|nr:hypothetical protein [Lachnospiraceae bacterium]